LSRLTSWTTRVWPGVEATGQARERLSELMSDDLPTLGKPTMPTVSDRPGGRCRAYDLRSWMSGAAPRASDVTGVVRAASAACAEWVAPADETGRCMLEMWVRCDWVDDLNGSVGKSCRR
jgi:hypothetical protein